MKEETNKICVKIVNKKTLEICGGRITRQYWGNEQWKETCEKCGDYQIKYEGARKT